MRYVYDGNVVVQELDQSNAPKVSYTRGRDLSGTMQGAGGIGGLLARTDNTVGTHAYYFADGNGNITSLTDGNQAVVASYLYDPYGRILSQSGPLAAANLYRFSSKELHVNSGLYYYLYRFYDPSLQRWLNRDPLGELSGANLYAFLSNEPITSADNFGLVDWAWWARLFPLLWTLAHPGPPPNPPSPPEEPPPIQQPLAPGCPITNAPPAPTPNPFPVHHPTSYPVVGYPTHYGSP